MIARCASVASAAIIFLLLTAGSLAIAEDETPFDPDAEFDRANRLYEIGDFDGATRVYRSIAAMQFTSPALWFNLGNAAYKTGNLGESIRYYRRALELTPRDPDFKANLAFVRSEVRKATGENAAARVSAIEILSLDEWTLIAAGSLWVWCVIMILRERAPQRRDSWRRPAILTGLAFLVAASCLGWVTSRTLSNREAVVVASQATVRFGPLAESQESFRVQDGEEVTILDRKGEWVRIQTGADRVGWIQADQIKPIGFGEHETDPEVE